MKREQSSVFPRSFDQWMQHIQPITGPEVYDPSGRLVHPDRPLPVPFVRMPYALPGISAARVDVILSGNRPSGRYGLEVVQCMPPRRRQLFTLERTLNEDTGEDFRLAVGTPEYSADDQGPITADGEPCLSPWLETMCAEPRELTFDERRALAGLITATAQRSSYLNLNKPLFIAPTLPYPPAPPLNY